MTEFYLLESSSWQTTELNYFFVEKVALLRGLASNNLFQLLELLVCL